ncbi:hypothetical protein [Bergeyella sp. RCAD1439]|uniref:hypothetical protein n=1 Tax=Bergeyella anatis TaxID=3113737 RepID=UPI002E1757C7|nr:hypothetical protein [Bergeyella sp. RCAD1439]
MPYLTDFSYRQLIDRIEIKDIERIDLHFFKKNIYENERIFYFFNQLELKKLFIEKILLSGEEKYNLVHKEVPEREDNYKYVLSIKGNVKYHKTNECPALFKGFKNFFMPECVVRFAEIDREKHKEFW